MKAVLESSASFFKLSRRRLPALPSLAIVLVMLAPAPAEAAFPGANGRIVYSWPGGGANNEIFSMNPDGSGKTNLSNNPAYDVTPSWSADGRRIAFARAPTPYDPFTTIVMNADGTGQTDIGSAFTSSVEPAWSPDGTKLVVTAQRAGDASYRLYVMNPDGSGVTQLTDPRGLASDGGPAWSPDGSKIAFASDRDREGDLEIYTVYADGHGGVTKLTDNSQFSDGEPDWSPDGTRIAFNGNGEIYAMNADGSGRTNLTNYIYNDYSPAWSPEGGEIVYIRSADGITIMRSDGSNPTPVNVIGGWPDWGVRPPGTSPPYQRPLTAPEIAASLVPTFKQCGTPGNPVNGAHSPPLSSASCSPAQPGGVARIGSQSTSSARLTAVPGDNQGTNGDQADLVIVASLTDVWTGAGLDYDPNAAGPDMTLYVRLRYTDVDNGEFAAHPATAGDLDFAVPIECTPDPSQALGADCGVNTTADAVLSGSIKEGMNTILQSFRLRVNDSGPNGTRGDSDDRVFATQGIFAP